MKKIVFLILSILLTSYLRAKTLSGKITDSITHEPISGAIVYIPELKLGTTTDDNGNFKISHIPKGSYEMEVKILGYATFTKQVTIRDNAICNCPMCPSSYSTNEVVITALGNVTNTQRSPMPVTLVSHQAMLEKIS